MPQTLSVELIRYMTCCADGQPAPDKLHWTELGAQEISEFTIAAMPFLESETVTTITYS